jgi:hypothetical protein
MVPPGQPRYAPKKSISLIEILRCTFPLFARYQQDGSLSLETELVRCARLSVSLKLRVAKAGWDFGYLIIKRRCEE